MNALVKDGIIRSFQPADILRTTDDEIVSVAPANRLYQHTEFIDYIVDSGKLFGNVSRRYRMIFMNAMFGGLKEFAYKIDVFEKESESDE